MSEENNKKEVIVWLTGNSGAGKTFTGDYLALTQNFIHIDGDQGYASNNEEKKKAFFDCVKAFDYRFEEKEAPSELRKTHFDLLIKESTEELKKGNKVVISFSVYSRQIRDYLRSNIPHLIYIQLSSSPKELIRKAKIRFENYAISQKKSVEEVFKEHNKMDYSEENFEKVTLNIMRGLMPLQKDELESGYYHSLNVDDGKTYFESIHKILNLENSVKEIPVEEIANINYNRFKNKN
jgi:gluconate kinase